MEIKLSDHFDYPKLMRFAIPSVVMMLFTSIYGVVDGFFVSNFAGKTEFAAVNFVMPFLMVLGAFGFLFGTGGSALVAMRLGEGKKEEANRIFSFLIWFSLICGVFIAAAGFFLVRPFAAFFGASGDLLENCVIYARIDLCTLPLFIMQMEFQSFFVTAEKPRLGLASTVIAGITNMVFDFILVRSLSMGIVGAALATASSEALGGLIPICYFLSDNDSLLRLGGFSFDLPALVRTVTNGCSELLSHFSMSLVSMIYNVRLIRYAGENGVAAYGVLMYVNFAFISCFIGYSVGTAPIVGFNYGAKNTDELKNILRKSAAVIAVLSAAMFVFGECAASPVSRLFTGYDAELFAMTIRAFRIFSFAFIFSGISVYGSSFFTALNDGLTSATISFLRTLVFQIAAVIILPIFFDLDGIWASLAAAEAVSAVFTVLFILKKRKIYNYL